MVAPKRIVHKVDLVGRTRADLEACQELGTARADLCLRLAEMVEDDLFAAGPKVAAAAQLAALLNAIGTGQGGELDPIERIKAGRGK